MDPRRHLTTRLVDTFTTPTLLTLIDQGRLDPTVFATHYFGLGETETAYDVSPWRPIRTP